MGSETAAITKRQFLVRGSLVVGGLFLAFPRPANGGLKIVGGADSHIELGQYITRFPPEGQLGLCEDWMEIQKERYTKSRDG